MPGEANTGVGQTIPIVTVITSLVKVLPNQEKNSCGTS